MFWEIAKHLKLSFQLRTLANLNQTCKAIRETTLGVLYETVIWKQWHHRVWEPRKGRVCEGLKYIKYMVLEDCLFLEVQQYAKRPGEKLPLDSFDSLFPQLVCIMLTAEPEEIGEDPDGSKEWETDFRLHLYKSITPIELLKACKTRPPPEDQDEELDSGSDDSDTDAFTPEDTYIDLIRGLTLHKNARLVTNDEFPLASLLKPVEGSWSIWSDLCFAPRLDLRHLTGDDEGLNVTLQGCAWLLQGEERRRSWQDAVAKVDCRLEMLQPLLDTYLTQQPFEFHINLCEDVDTTSFVAAVERVADFLSSNPERTKLAAYSREGNPFLEIRAGNPDTEAIFDPDREEELEDTEEFFAINYRAAFEYHVDESTRPPRCYFLLSVNAQFNPPDDLANRVHVQFDRSYYLGTAPARTVG